MYFKHSLLIFTLFLLFVQDIQAKERLSLSRREKEMEARHIDRKIENKRKLKRLYQNSQCRSATTFSPEQETPNPFLAATRIAEMLPPKTPLPAIEPAIPDSFVMARAKPHHTLDDGIFWGTADDTEHYLSQKEIKGPIFHLYWSRTERQLTKEGFLREESLAAQMKEEGLSEVHIQKLSWGDYPLLAISASHPTKGEIRKVWLGLNRPDQRVLIIELIAPSSDGSFVEHELLVWEPFLRETKPL